MSEQVQNKKRIFSSPLARRLAQKHNVNLTLFKGTGSYNRIIKRDIESFVENKDKDVKSLNMGDEQILALYKPDEYKLLAHDTMRKLIAKRLTESKQHIPHFYIKADCVLDKLLNLRSELNAAAPIDNDTGKVFYKLSINDMVIKAVAKALNLVPQANVSWLENSMIQHSFANIGVAVALDNGLITPIVKRAEQKSLTVISNEMKDLIKRAKEKKLSPDEYQGGSASISNLGMYGVQDFAAIVNPPQAVIFAISAASQRPIVKDNTLTIANVMSVTISVDHRAIDGAVAAQLIQAFKNSIENPLSMLI